jgi:hypothetical protein
MPVTISMEEWERALDDAQKSMPVGSEPGFTMRELCDKFCLTDTKMKAVLWEMIRAGRVINGRSRRIGICGTMRAVPVYILKGEK